MIYLIGMKHSGKTTVGRLTAGELSLPFIDLDDVILSIVDREKSGIFDYCRTVYSAFGGEYFRKVEAEAAEEIASGSETAVCALGGGTVENTAARARLRGTGCFVYLRESPDVLYSRVIQGGIPAFLDRDDPYGDFIRLCGIREKSYKKTADITITGGGRTPRDLAREAAGRIREEGYVG